MKKFLLKNFRILFIVVSSTALFFPGISFAQQQLCNPENDFQVIFEVRDTANKTLEKIPNTSTNIRLQGQVKPKKNPANTACRGGGSPYRYKAGFYVFSPAYTPNGFKDVSAPKEVIPTSSNGYTVNFTTDWQTSGLMDADTGRSIASGGKLRFQAYVYQEARGSQPFLIAKSDGVMQIAVGDAATNQPGAGSNGANPATPGSQATPAGPGGAPAIDIPGKGNYGSLGEKLKNPLKATNLGELMLLMMKIFTAIVAAWAIMFVVVGGFRLMTSQGNSEAVTKAKGTITWAIVGVIVSLLAFSAVAAVQNLIGYKGIL